MNLFRPFILCLGILTFASSQYLSAVSKTPNFPQSDNQAIELPLTSPPKIKRDTFIFDSYNDDGDYRLLNAYKGNVLYGFINDKNDQRDLLRGDKCIIEWKKDRIYIAGDGERPEWADWLVSIKKIEDGNISKFRSKYPNKIRFLSTYKDYSNDFLQQIFGAVEYFISNTSDEKILFYKESPNPYEYSIVPTTMNQREYIEIEIYYEREKSIKYLKSLYLDMETLLLYFYDEKRENLIEIKL